MGKEDPELEATLRRWAENAQKTRREQIAVLEKQMETLNSMHAEINIVYELVKRGRSRIANTSMLYSQAIAEIKMALNEIQGNHTFASTDF